MMQTYVFQWRSFVRAFYVRPKQLFVCHFNRIRLFCLHVFTFSWSSKMAGEFDKQHKFVGPMSYIVCQTQQDVYTFKNVNCCFYQSQQRNNNDETAERKKTGKT